MEGMETDTTSTKGLTESQAKEAAAQLSATTGTTYIPVRDPLGAWGGTHREWTVAPSPDAS